MTPRELLTFHGVIDIVERVLARHPGVSLDDLFTKDHAPHIARACQESWFTIRDERGPDVWSFPRLGRVFKRDHTTIMVGVRKCGRAAGLVEYLDAGSRGAA